MLSVFTPSDARQWKAVSTVEVNENGCGWQPLTFCINLNDAGFFCIGGTGPSRFSPKHDTMYTSFGGAREYLIGLERNIAIVIDNYHNNPFRLSRIAPPAQQGTDGPTPDPADKPNTCNDAPKETTSPLRPLKWDFAAISGSRWTAASVAAASLTPHQQWWVIRVTETGLFHLSQSSPFILTPYARTATFLTLSTAMKYADDQEAKMTIAKSSC